jgi:hypothetical protein
MWARSFNLRLVRLFPSVNSGLEGGDWLFLTLIRSGLMPEELVRGR